jgi:hypothetical protein
MSKDLQISDSFPSLSTPKRSINLQDSMNNLSMNIARASQERSNLRRRNMDQKNFICSIPIRLPKYSCQLPMSESYKILISPPNFFKVCYL